MVSPKSFLLYPDLHIQSRAPAQTAAPKADWVFSCPASHKVVSLSNFAPRPRNELLQFPSILRAAVDMQGHTEPGRIRTWVPAQTAVTATHTGTHILQGHPEAAIQLSWCRRGQSRRTYLWEQLCPLQAPEQPLHYCCTADDGTKNCPQWGLIPRQVTK